MIMWLQPPLAQEQFPGICILSFSSPSPPWTSSHPSFALCGLLNASQVHVRQVHRRATRLQGGGRRWHGASAYIYEGRARYLGSVDTHTHIFPDATEVFSFVSRLARSMPDTKTHTHTHTLPEIVKLPDKVAACPMLVVDVTWLLSLVLSYRIALRANAGQAYSQMILGCT